MFNIINMVKERGRLFELLKTFVVTSEGPNFLIAAKKIGISQAALSLHLKSLEALLPAPLFVLKGKKKILTPFGAALALHSRKILYGAEQNIDSFLNSYKEEERLVLRVGARPEMARFLFEKLRFTGSIQLLSMSGSEAEKAILDRTLDMALSWKVPDSLHIVAKKAFLSNPLLACIDQKPLPRSINEFDPKWFVNSTAISIDDSGHVLSDALFELGINFSLVPRRHVVNDWRGVLDCLTTQKRGYALLPSHVVNNLPVNVKMYPLSALGLKPLQYYFLYSKELREIKGYQSLISGL